MSKLPLSIAVSMHGACNQSIDPSFLSQVEGTCLSQGIASADHFGLWNASVGGCLGRGQLLRTLQYLHFSMECVRIMLMLAADYSPS